MSESVESTLTEAGVDPARAKAMESLRQWQEGIDRVAATLPDTLPDITRIIMAQDMFGAERNEAELRAGKITAVEAVHYTGSYARLDLAARLVASGDLPIGWLLDNLPDLWRGSDPDDTDPRYLRLWRLAFGRNGSYVRDGKALPRSRDLIVYRGQRESDPLGIAWTLDPKVARKFAKGAGLRVANWDGIVIQATIPRRVVYAYLTKRGESEVIIDPSGLSPVAR